METIRGYQVDADWDGEVLTLRGTSRVGRVALLGEGHAEGEVRLPVGNIGGVGFKDANPMVNGCLVVTDREGRRFQAHFRRRDREAWRALHEELQSALAV